MRLLASLTHNRDHRSSKNRAEHRDAVEQSA